MGLIQATGIGSSVDVEQIVGALLDAQKTPATQRLDLQEASTQASITGLGSLTSFLDEFKTSLTALSDSADFSKRKATSSDTDFITLSAGDTATPANFSVDVLSIAQGTRRESGFFSASTDTVGSGNLTFSAGSHVFSLAIEATDTLSNIRDKINQSADNFGVNANIINADSGTILVLDSQISGKLNQLNVTNDDSSLDAISTNLIIPTGGKATDAKISINGQTVSNDTNTFSTAIEDVTINVLKTTSSSIDLSISTDTTSVSNAISSFVDAFNNLAKVTSELGSSNPASPGILSGDATLRLLDRQIRRITTASVSGLNGNVNALAEIGISTNQDGTLTLDSGILNQQLTDHIDNISEIFTATNGIASSLTSLVDQYTNSNGILTTRNSSLNDKLTRIGEERIQLSDRLDRLETRLRAQFGAMDALVAQLKSSGNFLSQQLANLPGFSSNSNSGN